MKSSTRLEKSCRRQSTARAQRKPRPARSTTRTLPSKRTYVNRQCAFSTSANNTSQQDFPSIPTLKYIQYNSHTDVLAVLKSRGLISQTTPTISQHFGSKLDVSAQSLADSVNAVKTSVRPRLYASSSDDQSDQPQDLSTLRLLDAPAPTRTIYAGFDPTASSLHLGNLLILISLMHFHKAGHKVVGLVGGATGMIGDPSGRSTERVLQTTEQVHENASSIASSIVKLLDAAGGPAVNTESIDPSHVLHPPVTVNNFDWYHTMSIIDFLRDVGKHFRIPTMLAKDSVKSRLDNEEGLSLTEFTYQALQGYDYQHLHRTQNVTVQIGGNDQWGNITAGIDCVHRMRPTTTTDKATAATDQSSAKTIPPSDCHGLTLPLLTTAAGVKFGKSMGNAVWLNAEKTSSYHMFQYLLSTSDEDCFRFLHAFTFLSSECINDIMSQHALLPDVRIPQRVLAAEVVRLIHGDLGLKQALIATKLLFKDKFVVDMGQFTHGAKSSQPTTTSGAVATVNDDFGGLNFEQLLDALSGVPVTHIPTPTPEQLASLHENPLTTVNLAVAAQLANSKGDIRRLIKNNGFSIMNTKISQDGLIDTSTLPFGRIAILKSGQKKIHVAVLPENVEDLLQKSARETQ